jgi:16S rRNA (guanine527-N7)-methyltransferase
MVDLTPHQQRQMRAVLSLLEADEHAPTAIRTQEHAMQAHVADSLVALDLEVVRRAPQIADLGSGAGFPGLALAIALPEAEVTLVESQGRRCDFLRRLCAGGQVDNARVVCSRAEEWADGASSQDLVVVRALASQAVVLEYAAPLLRIGGALVDWRGKRDRTAEAAADRAAMTLGLTRECVCSVAPFEGATDRHLHVFVKTAATPPRFPRRPGIARKRPLGG